MIFPSTKEIFPLSSYEIILSHYTAFFKNKNHTQSHANTSEPKKIQEDKGAKKKMEKNNYMTDYSQTS